MTGLRELSAGVSRGALAALLLLTLSVSVLAPASSAFAQDEGTTSDRAAGAAIPEAEPPADFRGKVTLGYGMVVGAIVLYVLVSARRNARLTEEIEFLEQRVGELER